jgi:pimeloyl-ACP methyl ester carboxylesterase
MKKTEDITLKKTNIEINYEDWISDKNEITIVILHWWGGSSQSWLTVWELLFQSWFNVIVPDLPGFGKTKLEKVFDVEEYTTVVEEFIKELGLENIILWGHSNGWAISIKIANRWKVNIRRLVLNNSAWIRNDNKRSLKRKVLNSLTKIIKKIIYFIPSPIRRGLGWGYLRELFYRIIWWQDYLEAEKNPFLKQTYLNVIKADLSDELHKIKQDTLLIWWRNDTYTPLSDWMTMRNKIKFSKIIILENEKHWIHLTSPEKLVHTFLNNI